MIEVFITCFVCAWGTVILGAFALSGVSDRPGEFPRLELLGEILAGVSCLVLFISLLGIVMCA